MTKNLLYLAIGLLLFAGCSKSSQNSNTPTNLIVGKWTIAIDSSVEYVNGVRIINDVNFFPAGSYRQFNSDGTCTVYDAATNISVSSSTNVTYSLSADSIKFHYPASIANGYSYAAYTADYKLLMLSSNKLGIKFTEGTDGGMQNSFSQYYWYTK